MVEPLLVNYVCVGSTRDVCEDNYLSMKLLRNNGDWPQMSRFKMRDSAQKIVSDIAEATYNILEKELGISPPMKVHLLTESDWKQKFQGQPYGDPVAPGDGGIYYGSIVPKNWQQHFTEFSKCDLKYKDVVQTNINLIFYCTASHEVGHLFSNDLSSPKVLEQIEIDYTGDGVEILWLYELFSQYSMILFLKKQTTHTGICGPISIDGSMIQK